MDYRLYITKVEEQVKRMTKPQLAEWICAQARIVDEGKRLDFLNGLIGKREIKAELTEEEINVWCGQIEAESVYIEAEFKANYGAHGWDDEGEVEYQDAFDAMPYLEMAIHTCCQWLKLKEYTKVYGLLDRICRLVFHVEYSSNSEYDYEAYADDDGMSLEALASEGLIFLDFRNVSLNLLYACYQTETGRNRMDRLYEYFTWNMCKGIKMTDVFAFGPEQAKDTEIFMQEWCEYLTQISGDRGALLLVDACIFCGNDEYLLEIAGKNAKIHPSLYQVCCERRNQEADYTACIEIAKEAFRRIDENKTIRADIADIGARAAKEVNDALAWKAFSMEAFYSQPNSRHLFRLYGLQDRAMLDEALERVKTVPFLPFAGNAESEELRETAIVGEELKLTFQLLLGDYENMLKRCKEEKEYVGWSYHIKETMIPLLLLYLKNDENKKTKAERKLIENLKQGLRFESSDEESFEASLSMWRREYKLSEEQRQECIVWLAAEVDRRTEAVVGGRHRNSYHKAAELIVVMGAIQEEQGEVNGMHKLIDFYKGQHSRKSAFRSEIDELAKWI